MPIYVYSGAAGAGTGASWTDAYTSVNNAGVTGSATGSVIYVAADHVEDTTAVTPAYNNSRAYNPTRFYSVDRTSGNYTVGAAITNTSSASASPIAFQGATIFYGFKFTWTSTWTFTANGTVVIGYSKFVDCTFKVDSTSTSTFRFMNGGLTNSLPCTYVYENCTFDFTNGNSNGCYSNTRNSKSFFYGCTFTNVQAIFSAQGYSEANMIFECCTFTTASTTNKLAVSGAAGNQNWILRQCNVPSNWLTAGPLFGTITNGCPDNSVLMENCSTGTITTTPLGMTRLDSYYGTVLTDLSHYRTGGATDGVQANAYSWSMLSNTTASFDLPLRSPPIVQWVIGGASHTFTMYVASGTTLSDGTFWMVIEGPDSGGSVTGQGKFVRTKMAVLGSPTNLTTDTSTWNGTGVGTIQKVTYTYTPAFTGPVSIRASLGLASTQVYVDPLIGVS